MLGIVSSGIWKHLSQSLTKTPGTATAIALLAVSTGLGMAQAAGTLDSTFGTGGTATTIFNGQTITPIGAVEQPNGDIVVLSEADRNSQFNYTQFALTRYTSTGALDTTFGTNGTTLTAFSTFTFGAFALALEPNGEFLVAGGILTAAGIGNSASRS
jgi:hypothetical protein